MPDDFSFGIEEEYFLVDAQTKSAVRAMPEPFLKEAKAALGGKVSGEFLQSQIEAVTPPMSDMAAARAELRMLRATLAEIAARHGLALFAAGTHPTASWESSRQSEGERYDAVMDDLQMIGQRNMLCGMHVHVELPDPIRRVDVMTRMLPFLPLFIALSTSSPFWRARQTGLKGYRLAAYDELPRTGIPELFRGNDEYDAYVKALVDAGVMPDASYIWWAIRPSLKHPTLELRAADCCTRRDDTLAIAALYRALARRLFLKPFQNWDLTAVSRAIIVENKWRAQRYGIDGTFVKIEGGGAISVSDFVDQVVSEVTPDAEALGCRAEVEHCRRIVEIGTSADMQVKLYDEFPAEPARGLRSAIDWVAATTVR
jgi:carboxylate-amine ligase